MRAQRPTARHSPSGRTPRRARASLRGRKTSTSSAHTCMGCARRWMERTRSIGLFGATSLSGVLTTGQSKICLERGRRATQVLVAAAGAVAEVAEAAEVELVGAPPFTTNETNSSKRARENENVDKGAARVNLAGARFQSLIRD